MSLIEFLVALPLGILAAWLVTNDDRKTDPDGEEVSVETLYEEYGDPVGRFHQ